MKSKFETKWLVGSMMVLCLVFGFIKVNAATEYALGNIPLDPETYNKLLKIWPEEATKAIPSSYDARDYGLVTPAKDQGYCGSCWAFASVGGMESHILKKYGGGPYDLSEQQLVSCETTSFGCCGGYPDAIQYWETQGPIYESCFPYGDSGTICPPTYSTVNCSGASGCTQLPYRVTNFHTVSATSIQMNTSLYNDGPSFWYFDVYSDFFNFWNEAGQGDVYVNSSGSFYRGGHAVLLIGWDDSKGAFLCKNSWGATGGPNGDGTFWIAYIGHYYGLDFGMVNFNLNDGPTYKFCFNPSSSDSAYQFNKTGMWFAGVATGGSCSDGLVLGALYEGKWILARDIPSDDPLCVETVFYLGIYPGKNYDWINSSGYTGTGRLYSCAAGGERAAEDDCLNKGTEPLDRAKDICLEDQYGILYNLTVWGGQYIQGTVIGSCGTYIATGMVVGRKFSFYVDIPSDAIGCVEGYLVVGNAKTLTGYWYNTANLSDTMTFTRCGEKDSETVPPAGPAPDQRY